MSKSIQGHNLRFAVRNDLLPNFRWVATRPSTPTTYSNSHVSRKRDRSEENRRRDRAESRPRRTETEWKSPFFTMDYANGEKCRVRKFFDSGNLYCREKVGATGIRLNHCSPLISTRLWIPRRKLVRWNDFCDCRRD